MTQTSTTLALAGFSFMMTVIWGPPLLRGTETLQSWEIYPG